MRRFFTLIAMIACAALAQADMKYLVFTAQDGTETNTLAENLTITFADGLLLTNTGLELEVAQLAKMHFAENVGIEEVLADDVEGDVEVFLPSGTLFGRYRNATMARMSLRPGLYVMKKGKNTMKILVK